MTHLPKPEMIQKEYPYKNEAVWIITIGVLISVSGILSILEKQFYWSGVIMVVGGFLFLLSGLNVIQKTPKNPRLIITETHFYLPSWEKAAYIKVAFSEITEIILAKRLRGQELLLTGKEWIPHISSIGLPSKDSFDEIVNIIRERTNL
ncbi:MAG: hypothetical protein Q7T89_07725 [Anaerolineales bacterium]|nr:hypothetical protein [Anaerolineales bacterium]